MMLMILLHRNQIKLSRLLGIGCILRHSGLSMISFSSSVKVAVDKD